MNTINLTLVCEILCMPSHLSPRKVKSGQVVESVCLLSKEVTLSIQHYSSEICNRIFNLLRSHQALFGPKGMLTKRQVTTLFLNKHNIKLKKKVWFSVTVKFEYSLLKGIESDTSYIGCLDAREGVDHQSILSPCCTNNPQAARNPNCHSREHWSYSNIFGCVISLYKTSVYKLRSPHCTVDSYLHGP